MTLPRRPFRLVRHALRQTIHAHLHRSRLAWQLETDVEVLCCIPRKIDTRADIRPGAHGVVLNAGVRAADAIRDQLRGGDSSRHGMFDLTLFSDHLLPIELLIGLAFFNGPN